MILGNAWRESGYIAQCFSPWLYALVISSSLAGLITVCERQSMGLKFQTVLSILRFAALSLGLYYGTLTQAIMCYSLVSAACWLALATKLLTDLGISGRAIFQLQLRCLARGLLFAAPALFYKCFANPSDLWVCISCAASLAGYWLWVYGLKHGSRSD